VNKLEKKYPQEIQHVLSKYPKEHKRSAVMPLLYLAQRDGGFVSEEAMQDIAEILDLTKTEVASIIGFYTLFHSKAAGKYRIQICNDLPCALRGADSFLEELCKELGIKPGETTPDGLVTIEPVMCLAACHRAPVFQVQKGDELVFYENQSVESALALIKSWREQEQQGNKEETA